MQCTCFQCAFSLWAVSLLERPQCLGRCPSIGVNRFVLSLGVSTHRNGVEILEISSCGRAGMFMIGGSSNDHLRRRIAWEWYCARIAFMTICKLRSPVVFVLARCCVMVVAMI